MEQSSKMEHSSKWNTPIIKMEHSYYQNGILILKRSLRSIDKGVLDRASSCIPIILWTSTHKFKGVLDRASASSCVNGILLIGMPWIIAKSLGSSFNDLLKTIKTIFTHITVSFSLTQGSPPLPQLDFSPRFDFPLSPRSLFHTRLRFLLPNHVTSGCMRPRSLFFRSAVLSPPSP